MAGFNSNADMPADPLRPLGSAALSSRRSSAAEDGAGPLPEVVRALLDRDAVARLLAEIAAGGEDVEVQVKQAAEGYTDPAHPTLEDARALLDAGAVYAVQVRYRLAGTEWCDTLLSASGGARLVRIRHDPPPQAPPR